jgi:hypothetical protein
MNESTLDLMQGRVGDERRRPWGGLSPDEAVMAAEERGEDEWSFSAAVGCLLAFLFADGAEDWRKVAGRASALLRRYAVARAERMDLPRVSFEGWGLEEFFKLVGSDGRAMLGRVLAWFYREDGRNGLLTGTQRVFLFTRVLDPQLTRVPEGAEAGARDREMTFEDMAVAFGERKDGARARWSARGKKMVGDEFARAGGAFARGDFFGKGHAAREKYRARALGNRNRVKSQETRIKNQEKKSDPNN